MNIVSTRKRGKLWEYRFKTALINGKRHYQSKCGFSTKRDAEKAGMEAFRLYHSAGQVRVESDISFGDYLMRWLDEYCLVNLKQTTCDGYRKKITRYINPALGSYHLITISPMILQNFINDMFDRGYSRNTLSVLKGLITGAMKYAVTTLGVLTSNPAQNIRIPPKRAKSSTPSRQKKRVSLTKEEWNRILERFPEDHSCYIPLLLGYHLGLRLGEAFALTWDDVDFEAGMIHVCRQVQWAKESQSWYCSNPKYDSIRDIAMDKVLIEALRKEKDRQDRGRTFYGSKYQQIKIDESHVLGKEGIQIHLICCRPDGTYIQPRVTQHLNKVCHKELDLPLFDFHTLRHTHATLLLEAGASMVDIQHRLGHAKLSMSMRYVHDTAALQEQTKAILAGLYDEKLQNSR